MINSRSETLTEKPAYASLLQSQRYIIIANGYYERMRISQDRRPYYIHDTEIVYCYSQVYGMNGKMIKNKT